MDFSTVDTDTLRAWHSEAQTALHALMTGRREASISVGAEGSSRAVSYTQASLPDLRAYLMALAAELSRRGVFSLRRRRAIGVRI